MKPSPKAWLVEFENGEEELHFDEQSVGEIHTPLYTAPIIQTYLEKDSSQPFQPDGANFEEGRKVGREEAEKELTKVYGLLALAHLNLKQHLEYGFNPKTAQSTLISVGKYYPRLKKEMEKP
jgi:hypothetical protein